MKKRGDYKKLIARQVAMDLVDLIYTLTKKYPKEEQFGLTSQIRRAASSIALNIAEWNWRNSNKDYSHFLNIAFTSTLEVESAAIISLRQWYLVEQELRQIEEFVDRIKKLIYGLDNSLH